MIIAGIWPIILAGVFLTAALLVRWRDRRMRPILIAASIFLLPVAWSLYATSREELKVAKELLLQFESSSLQSPEEIKAIQFLRSAPVNIKEKVIMLAFTSPQQARAILPKAPLLFHNTSFSEAELDSLWKKALKQSAKSRAASEILLLGGTAVAAYEFHSNHVNRVATALLRNTNRVEFVPAFADTLLPLVPALDRKNALGAAVLFGRELARETNIFRLERLAAGINATTSLTPGIAPVTTAVVDFLSKDTNYPRVATIAKTWCAAKAELNSSEAVSLFSTLVTLPVPANYYGDTPRTWMEHLGARLQSADFDRLVLTAPSKSTASIAARPNSHLCAGFAGANQAQAGYRFSSNLWAEAMQEWSGWTWANWAGEMRAILGKLDKEQLYSLGTNLLHAAFASANATTSKRIASEFIYLAPYMDKNAGAALLAELLPLLETAREWRFEQILDCMQALWSHLDEAVATHIYKALPSDDGLNENVRAKKYARLLVVRNLDAETEAALLQLAQHAFLSEPPLSAMSWFEILLLRMEKLSVEERTRFLARFEEFMQNSAPAAVTYWLNRIVALAPKSEPEAGARFGRLLAQGIKRAVAVRPKTPVGATLIPIPVGTCRALAPAADKSDLKDAVQVLLDRFLENPMFDQWLSNLLAEFVPWLNPPDRETFLAKIAAHLSQEKDFVRVKNIAQASLVFTINLTTPAKIAESLIAALEQTEPRRDLWLATTPVGSAQIPVYASPAEQMLKARELVSRKYRVEAVCLVLAKLLEQVTPSTAKSLGDRFAVRVRNEASAGLLPFSKEIANVLRYASSETLAGIRHAPYATSGWRHTLALAFNQTTRPQDQTAE